jgi:hypothetical protein
MISVTRIYETLELMELEDYIENLTVACCETYQDEFVDAAVKYLEEDDHSILDVYFESHSEVLNELKVNISKEDVEAAKKHVKEKLKESAKQPVKKSLIRKLTSKMYKNKVGRAIVKGIRKAGYGTKLGRKVMGKYADVKQAMAKGHSEMGKKFTKSAGQYGAMAKGLERDVIGNALYGDTAKNARDSFVKAAGAAGQRARSSMKAANQTKRNLKMTGKREPKVKFSMPKQRALPHPA